MPRGDKSGPTGEGPRTGRGAGSCAGTDSPGYENQAPQYGMGRGGGRRRGQRGRGFGGRFADGPNSWVQPGIEAQAAASPQAGRENEKQSLQNQAQSILTLLGAISQQIGKLTTDRDRDAD